MDFAIIFIILQVLLPFISSQAVMTTRCFTSESTSSSGTSSSSGSESTSGSRSSTASESSTQTGSATQTGTTQICYSLFISDAEHAWDSAQVECQKMGYTLAVMEDDIAQRQIQELLTGADPGIQDIWIGGRRSVDNQWRYEYGDKQTEALDGTFPSDEYCAAVSGQAIKSTVCTASNVHALCQYVPDTTGSCQGDDEISDDFCYHTSLEEMTWFEAANYCRRTFTGGRLATQNPFPDTVAPTLIPDEPDDSSKDDIELDVSLWIALTRRPWTWVKSSGNDTVQWFNFGESEGSDENQQSCLYLTPDGTSSWADKSCADTCQAFICQSEVEVPVTMVTKAVSATAFPSTTTTVVEQQNSMIPVYIGATVAVLVVVGVVVAVLLILRRRSRLPKHLKQGLAQTIINKSGGKIPTITQPALPDDWPTIQPSDSNQDTYLQPVVTTPQSLNNPLYNHNNSINNPNKYDTSPTNVNNPLYNQDNRIYSQNNLHDSQNKFGSYSHNNGDYAEISELEVRGQDGAYEEVTSSGVMNDGYEEPIIYALPNKLPHVKDDICVDNMKYESSDNLRR